MLAYYAYKKHKETKAKKAATKAAEEHKNDKERTAVSIPLGPDGNPVADPHGSPVEEQDFHHGFAAGYSDGVQHGNAGHQVQKY